MLFLFSMLVVGSTPHLAEHTTTFDEHNITGNLRSPSLNPECEMRTLGNREILPPANNISYVPNELIIKFSSSYHHFSSSFMQRYDSQFGITSITPLIPQHQAKNTRLSEIYTMTYSKSVDPFDVAEVFSSDRSVVYAHPNYQVSISLEPNDPYYYSYGTWGQDYQDLYGIHNINCSSAWNISQGSSSVVVGVIDTGIDPTHEDIINNLWINTDEVSDGADTDGDGFVDNLYGADFYNSDGDPQDGYGHGTHCAGTIAAIGNNNIGVVGVNWQTSIMSIKVFSDSGRSTADIIVPGFTWAIDQGAHVLSNSWSVDEHLPSIPVFEDMVHYGYEHDVTMVFSAGNSNDDVKWYCPQNMKETITVAALTPDDKKAFFSNYGELVDVAAPGVDILSLRANGTSMGYLVDKKYTRASGTSMSCPHAAGVAALLLARDSSYTPPMIKTMITASADPLSTPLLGGRLNAGRAMIKNPAIALLYPITIPHNEILNITGSAWGGLFEQYCVSYGSGEKPSEWFEIETSTTPVLEGRLATFDASVLSQGIFTIRLEVICEDDTYKDITRFILGDSHCYIVDDCEGRIVNELISFKSIQEAIDYAQDGDRIFIKSGTYQEHIVVNKEIELIGESRCNTFLDGGAQSSVIHVTTKDVFIKGFTIRNAEYGVFVTATEDVCVVGNNFIDTEHPIYNGGLNNCYYTTAGGNYYDDYTGIDADDDGVGDSPYEREEDNFYDAMPLISKTEECLYVPTTVYVDTDFTDDTPGFGYDHFEFLHTAVHAVRPGGTIHVNSGRYYIRRGVIYKPLQLIGSDQTSTVINGFGDDHILCIFADDVTLQKIRIQDSGRHRTGLWIQANATRVDQCSIVNNWHGVQLDNFYRYPVRHLDDCVITNTLFEKNIMVSLWIKDAWNFTFHQNSMYDNYFGVYLDDCQHANITSNYLDRNYYAMTFMDSTRFVNISCNKVANSLFDGISIDNGEAISPGPMNISHNIVADNFYYGIWLRDTKYIDVHHNYISSNWKGVFLESHDIMTVYCAIHENIIEDNGYFGVHVNDDEQYNAFYHNNFLNNYYHAYDESWGSFWDDDYPSGGNYWDNYTGSDLFSGPDQNETGSDGIGDTPVIISRGQGGIQIDHFPFIEPQTITIKIPPIAQFTTSKISGGIIKFDASDSTDYDGTIFSYQWDFGDGTTGIGQTIEHSFASDGTFTVTLTVEDNMGLSGSCQQQVTADSSPPHLSFHRPSHRVYINNRPLIPFIRPLIIGHIVLQVNASDELSGIDYVDFYDNNELLGRDEIPPYEISWDDTLPFNFRHTISVIASDQSGNQQEIEQVVWEVL